MPRISLLACAFALLITGCAGAPGREPVAPTLFPQDGRLGNALRHAATDTLTWLPLAGAAALQLGNADRRLSVWASRNTPVFGSKNGALDASDTLRNATDNAALLSALLAPAPVPEKAGLLALEAAGASLTLNSTGYLKQAVGRTRPYGYNSDSFPSAHASTVFNRAVFGVLNTEEYDLAPVARTGIDVGFYTAATATAWARVEAGVHYPSDVLVGAALGNFLARFIYEGFIHEPGTPATAASAAILPAAGGTYLQIALPF